MNKFFYSDYDVVMMLFVDGEIIDFQMAAIEYVNPKSALSISALSDIEACINFDFGRPETINQKWVRVGFNFVVDREVGNHFEVAYVEILNL